MMESVYQIHSLSKSEVLGATQLLRDFDACVSGPWMLVGSLSYRIHCKTLNTQGGLRDIDLVLLPDSNQDPRVLLSPEISKHFLVTRIHAHTAGYYYRLCHLATHIWVDLFTEQAGQVCVRRWVRIGNTPLQACTTESSLLHLVNHLLELAANGQAISVKYLFVAMQLWRKVDRGELFRQLRRRREDLRQLLPARVARESEFSIVEYALNIGPSTGWDLPRRVHPELSETVHGITLSERSAITSAQLLAQRKSFLGQLKNKVWRWRMKYSVGRYSSNTG